MSLFLSCHSLAFTFHVAKISAFTWVLYSTNCRELPVRVPAYQRQLFANVLQALPGEIEAQSVAVSLSVFTRRGLFPVQAK